eukprot:15365020-Ditylum_brightwellii.AAC.1
MGTFKSPDGKAKMLAKSPTPIGTKRGRGRPPTKTKTKNRLGQMRQYSIKDHHIGKKATDLGRNKQAASGTADDFQS